MTAPSVESAPAVRPSSVGSVLVVGNFLSASVGNRGVCEDLAERLAAAGWQVTMTSERTGRFARLADMLRTVWARRHSYDVAQVDVYSGPAFFWAGIVCLFLRCLGKPYILTLHGGNLPAFSERWPGMVGSLLASAATVTVPSGYLLERMRRFRADLRLLPNAVDISNYPFRLRESLRPRLVWVRAFHRIYDPSQAVRVIARLLPEFPGVELAMVGPDKKDGSLEAASALAETLNVTTRIQHVGRVAKTEVGQWIDRGDIFLNTSTIDNNPVTLLEAMACGACVVSTNVGGIPYTAEHGVDALLVPPGDTEAMANSVAMLLRRPDMALALSRNARSKAESFDWGSILPEWQSLLATTIHKQNGVTPS
ncbi:MAG: glycosyltransferase family 4 protein [Candidatus Solibacter sp.]